MFPPAAVTREGGALVAAPAGGAPGATVTQMMVPPGVMRAESLAEGGAHTPFGVGRSTRYAREPPLYRFSMHHQGLLRRQKILLKCSMIPPQHLLAISLIVPFFLQAVSK